MPSSPAGPAAPAGGPVGSSAEVTVPLRTVLDRVDLGVRAVVAPEGAGVELRDVAVRWAHPSEVRDPVPYLLGSELLLTAGVALPTADGQVDGYVTALVRAGVRALGFGLTPVYDAVPPALVASCRRRGLPLLEVPESTPFLAVSRAVAEAIDHQRTEGLRRLSEAEIALTRAATRTEPVAATLSTLAGSLGCWVVLLAAGGVADAAGAAPALSSEVLELAERLRDGSGPRSAGAELVTPDGVQPLVLHPVESAATRPSVLVAGRGHGFTVADRAVLAVAVALLGVLDRERSGGTGRSHRALTRLLFDQSTSDSAVASVLGVDAGGRYRVLHADPRGAAVDLPVRTPLVLWEGGRARAIVPDGRDVLDALGGGWHAGVSAAVGAEQIPEADAEAAAMLERSRAVGRPVRADSGGTGLSEVLDPDRAAEFARRTLAPLRENRSLLRTLQSWLAHNGSWHHTSLELDIHRNSVRHRIKQVERLLGVDLASTQQRVELWVALQWLPPGW